MKDPHTAYLKAMEIAKAQAEIDAATARRNKAAKEFAASVRTLMKKHKFTLPDLLAELPGWSRHRLNNFLYLDYRLDPKETTALLRAVAAFSAK